MIEVSVPIRICDLGGWTDTWFGAPGRVVNIAVTPGVHVSLRALEGPPQVMVHLDSTGESYAMIPCQSRVARHPIVEAAIDLRPPPNGLGVEVRVDSAVPAGSGTGTSAAVAVALLGGLGALRGEQWSPADIATTAHRLEVDVLGLESGIQDQVSAAFGGINYLEIDAYPGAAVHPLPVWDDLSDHVTLVGLGRAHDSSGLHREVIQHIAGRAPDAFDALRAAAVAARDAVREQDLRAFGDAMIRNTDAQRSLHPDLVGEDARRVIDFAARRGSIGWKVNGAGGDGGSLTLLSASPEAKRALEAHVERVDRRYRIFPIEISAVGLDITGSV